MQLGRASAEGMAGGYLVSAAMVAAATGAGLSLGRYAGGGTDLLYLVPVLAASALYGFRHGAATSLASAFCYNFFFTEPVHSLRISDPANVLTVLILLAVSIVTSRLAARLKDLAGEAAERAAFNETLVGLANQLLGCATAREIGNVICREAGRLLEVNAMFLAAGRLLASRPSDVELGVIDTLAADRADQAGVITGRWTGSYAAADWTFFPLKPAEAVIGIVGVARDDGLEAVPREQEPLFRSMLAQAVLALERVRLQSEVVEVAQLREKDRLRGALLSSVSHDLRTPLTAIAAASGELRHRGEYDAQLVETVGAETRRLDRLIGNLLDMTRVEAGAIRLRPEAVDLEDAVAAALSDVEQALDRCRVARDFPPDLPIVRADPRLLHHCLINLLENAARHSPSGGEIQVAGRAVGGAVELVVIDSGPGIPPGREVEIFERFIRIEGSDRSGGAGLGLAIVKGFAEAMGIEVRAGNRSGDPGAEFVLCFPADRVVPLQELAS